MNQYMYRALFLGLIAVAIVTVAIITVAILTIYPQDASVVDKSQQDANASDKKCAGGDQLKWTYTPVNPPKITSRASFSVPGKEDKTLADYKGFGLVVNFWATWCAPCVREMPSLDRLQALVKDDGIKVMTISEDRGGIDVINRFYKKIKIKNLPILLDNRGKLMRSSKIFGLPETLLINPQGLIWARITGSVEWDSPEIVDFLRQCLRVDNAKTNQ